MLDGPTALVVAAGMFLILPLLVWVSLRTVAQPAVLWWCGGSLLAGTGIVLIGLREGLPTVLTYHVANTALLSSFLGWAQSLRLQLRRPWSRTVMVGAIVGNALLYAVLYLWAEETVRGLTVRLLLGVLAGYTATLAWQLARQGPSKSAAAIAASYGVLSLAFVLQLVVAGWQPHDPDPFSRTWDAGVLALMAMLTAVVGHFSYAGMMLDATTREHLQSLQQRMREEGTRRLDLQLVQQEHERHLSLVAASLAHEINQPLTVASAQLELIERLDQTVPQQRQQLPTLFAHIQTSVDRAAAILERTRAAREQLAMQPVEWMAQLQLAIQLLEPLMQQHQVRIDLAAPPRQLWCEGDALALSQVMVNLMRNAIEAMQAQPGTRVLRLRLCREDKEAVLRVDDTGPGLPPAMLGHWGQLFNTTKASALGQGLGLPISLDIVEQHRGRMTLENQPGGGARATVRLPLLREGPT